MLDTRLTAPSVPRGYRDLTYLSYDRKTAVVGGTLASFFKVDTWDHARPVGATLSIGGQPWAALNPPDQPYFERQLRYIRNYSDLRTDRITEIHTQIYDILSYMGAAFRLDAGQRKHSLEFLQMAHGVVSQVVMRIKHHCWAPRPVDYSTNVHPIIQTPVHSTFPSGHAAEAFALAIILHHLSHKPDAEPRKPLALDGVEALEMPFRIAHRIAVNRTVAGLHFPVDNAAGAFLGLMLGEAILAICTPKPKEEHPKAAEPFKFTFGDNAESLMKPEQDFTLQWMIEATQQFGKEDALSALIATADQDPILAQMYSLATQEWA
jgi:membrane-associated phospholipid phosphatase